MLKALVLIETKVGKTREVVAAVKGIEGVTTADCVTGPYDIIAVVEGGSVNEIAGVVTGKIQLVHGISRTVCCLPGTVS